MPRARRPRVRRASKPSAPHRLDECGAGFHLDILDKVEKAGRDSGADPSGQVVDFVRRLQLQVALEILAPGVQQAQRAEPVAGHRERAGQLQRHETALGRECEGVRGCGLRLPQLSGFDLPSASVRAAMAASEHRRSRSSSAQRSNPDMSRAWKPFRKGPR